MDWRLFLCVLLTWSLVSASPANRPLDESRSSDDDFVEYLQGLPRSRQKRQTSNPGSGQKPCGSGRPAIVTLSQGANEVIKYPGIAERYPDDAHCQWRITAPAGKRVQVHFNSFYLEDSTTCSYDKLEIFDGSTTHGGDTFGKFCGYATPPDVFSSHNIITVLFRSNSYITQRGFKITLSAVDAGGSEPNCGIPHSSWVSGNIVGRQQSSPHSWPWQILLQKDRRFICGGSILSKDWIITAAHCVIITAANRLSVIVGEHDRTATEGTEQLYAVASIFIHEEYTGASNGSDIALLRLVSGIHYTTVSKPICLPLTEATSGTTCYATGWGTTGGLLWMPLWQSTSNVLMEATLQIINQSTCRRSDWLGSQITSTMLCAGYAQGRRDTCQDDSGGPLVCLSNDQFLLHGITSWGYPCGGRNSPGVYTRVSQFTDWVHQKTNGAFQSAP